MLVVSISLCALVSLVYSDPQESLPAVCVGNFCYSLSREERKFNMARGICKKNGGDAMTVRTTVAAEAIAVLLQRVNADPSSHFWLGLQLHQRTCPSNSSRLRGYRWVNGDNDTDYTYWGSVSEECGPRCVAISGRDRWVDRPCNKKANGVLCEYRYNSSCEPLTLNNSSVTYLTPFGARSFELTSLPQGTKAEVSPSDIRLQCNGSLGWVGSGPGPWVCQVNNGGCEHTCQEGPPPKCSCRSGYRLNSDELSCRAVDPCKEEKCAHSCQQRDGKPVCSCDSGFTLGSDHKSCTDIDECLSNPCEHTCKNTQGSFQCSCKKGYQMSQDGKCEDINECQKNPCEHKCSNTPGSFECNCWSGYKVSLTDETKCVWYCDSDTCPAHCFGNECTCPPDFILNDLTQICHDIDECQFHCQGHPCTNFPGSFKCECREGYESVNGACEPEGSGDITMIEVQTTKPTTYSIPASAGLSLSVVLGTIFAIAVLTLICAGVGHHLFKKRGKWQTSTKYKSANVEEDVNLSQVTTGEDCKHQYSNEKCNMGT